MTPADRQPSTEVTTTGDALVELAFALAEAGSERTGDALRTRVLEAALSFRPPGRPARPAEPISGVEAFRRAVDGLAALLADLEPSEWATPALRDLDVQGLVGHLIGVETAFAASLRGEPPVAEGDHVTSTQAAALAQDGRHPDQTRADWAAAVTQSAAAAAAHPDPDATVSFYGMTLPLDQVLVVRAFELWIHEEDIRRATERPLPGPDPGRLARMVELAVSLLPAGLARAGQVHPGRGGRLVITGPGGGTWDVALDGRHVPRPADTRVVVDAAAFCRMVGARQDPVEAGARVTGDVAVAAGLFAGAAALALD